MPFNTIRNCLDCDVLYIIQMNYNGIYTNYEYNNLNCFDKRCIKTI